MSTMRTTTYRVVCEVANIDQEFLDEDVEGLLKDLPDLVEAEKRLALNEALDEVVNGEVDVFYSKEEFIANLNEHIE